LPQFHQLTYRTVLDMYLFPAGDYQGHVSHPPPFLEGAATITPQVYPNRPACSLSFIRPGSGIALSPSLIPSDSAALTTFTASALSNTEAGKTARIASACVGACCQPRCDAVRMDTSVDSGGC
jgi:hypothetical protein